MDSETLPITEVSDRQTEVSDEDYVGEYVGGYTVEEHPTFWFYLPYVLPSTTLLETPQVPSDIPSKRVAQFVLLDETDHPVWKELVSTELLEHPQLLEYQLPYGLETKKLYKWYFSVICDPEKRSRNPAVRGWVQHIEPTTELQMALSIAPPVEWHRIYAEKGIWFEAVSSLISNRRNFPSASREDWSSLLTYFKIAEEEDTNQFSLLQLAEPVDREVVINGNQLPARM